MEKNNLQLKMNEINIQLAAIDIQKNKLNYSPNVNAQSNYSLRIGKNYNYFENKYENQIVHYNDFNLNLQQPIFDGLLTPNQVQKSKFDYEALKLDNDALKRNLQMQTMTAYLNILNAKEQLEQAKIQQLSTIEQQTKTDAMIDAGALPESNRYDIEAQMATEEANIVMAKNQLNLALLNLKVLLQIDLNEVIDVKVPD
ncbi:MAG TPA: TolC family protein, partial [Chitinophagales bacterium]|nr:TolC family protein [Chitinophagales bacterium]